MLYCSLQGTQSGISITAPSWDQSRRARSEAEVIGTEHSVKTVSQGQERNEL